MSFGVLTLDNVMSFTPGLKAPNGFKNFSRPEEGFIWSTAKSCEISFPFDPGAAPPPAFCDLILDLDAFKVDGETEGQTIKVFLNGLRIGARFVDQRVTATLKIRSHILTRVDNLLVIDTPEAHSPSDFGDADKRTLGIKLFSIRLRRPTQ